MSIVLNSTPGSYYSAHDALVFTPYEATKATDNQTYPDYKYVLDLYIDSVLQARLKAFPQPDNFRGVFDISRIVRNFLGLTFNPTLGQIRAQQFGAGKYYIDVTCKFGEDYNFTTYTNVLIDSVRRYYNHYNGRQVGTLTTLATYTNKPLSNGPNTRYVELADTAVFLPYLPSTSADVTLTVNASTYTWTPAADTVELLNVSPTAINAQFAGLITAATTSYTITIGGMTITYNLTCNGKYENKWIHFLNKFGCYESFPFALVSKRSFEVDKKSIGQLPYTIGSDGSVNFRTGQAYNELTKVYSSQFSEKQLLNTDLLTDAEYQWLSELVFSPEVYIQESGYFIPVTITANNYEEKQYIVDGQTNLEITVEYGRKFNTQYR